MTKDPKPTYEENRCPTCNNAKSKYGGHCSKFKEKPQEKCAQFAPKLALIKP